MSGSGDGFLTAGGLFIRIGGNFAAGTPPPNWCPVCGCPSPQCHCVANVVITDTPYQNNTLTPSFFSGGSFTLEWRGTAQPPPVTNGVELFSTGWDNGGQPVWWTDTGQTVTDTDDITYEVFLIATCLGCNWIIAARAVVLSTIGGSGIGDPIEGQIFYLTGLFPDENASFWDPGSGSFDPSGTTLIFECFKEYEHNCAGSGSSGSGSGSSGSGSGPPDCSCTTCADTYSALATYVLIGFGTFTDSFTVSKDVIGGGCAYEGAGGQEIVTITCNAGVWTITDYEYGNGTIGSITTITGDCPPGTYAFLIDGGLTGSGTLVIS